MNAHFFTSLRISIAKYSAVGDFFSIRNIYSFNKVRFRAFVLKYFYKNNISFGISDCFGKYKRNYILCRSIWKGNPSLLL